MSYCRWFAILLPILSAAAVPQTPFRNVFFEPNRGQAPEAAEYVARARGNTLGFTRQGAAIGTGERTVLLRFAGTAGPARWEPLDAQPGSTNYILGADSRQWIRNVPHYRRLAWRGVYPGIDAVFYGTEGRLEYDLVVAPGADASRIRLRFDDADAVTRTAAGSLAISAGRARFEMHLPRIYQRSAAGKEVAVQGRYRLLASGEVAFELGKYDRSRPLVVDPVVQFTAYYGGEKDDSVVAITEAGDIVGTTSSIAFGSSPLRAGRDIFAVVATTYNGFNSQSTYIFGGTGDDVATSATSTSSYLMIGGWTTSPDYPDTRPKGGTDGLLIFINRQYSYYPILPVRIGGSGDDHISALIPANTSACYFAGDTTSADLAFRPTPLSTSYSGGMDVMVGYASGGSVFSLAYYGGSGDDAARAVVLDGSTSRILVAGKTTSADLPLVSPWQDRLNGPSDGFLFSLDDPSGTMKPVLSTYFGGSGNDEIDAISIFSPSSGSFVGQRLLTVTGVTSSTDLPLASAYQNRYGGGSTDAFLTRWNRTTGALLYSSYLGGGGDDEATSLAVDTQGSTIVAGSTTSGDLPLSHASQSTLAGPQDGWVGLLTLTGELDWLSYFGGSGADRILSAAITPDNLITIGGETTSPDLPAPDPNTSGTTAAGGQDGFIARLAAPRFFSKTLDPLYTARRLRMSRTILIGGMASESSQVTITSSDPSLVAVLLPNSNSPVGRVSLPLRSMGGSSFTLTVTGLAESGDAEVRIELDGAGVQVLPVRVRPLAVQAVGLYPTIYYEETSSVTPLPGVVDDEGKFLYGEIIYGPGAPVVVYSSSDESIARLSRSTTDFSSYDYGDPYVIIRPTGIGEFTLSASVTGAQLSGPSSRTVQVLAPVVTIPDFSLGRGLGRTLAFRSDHSVRSGPYSTLITTDDPDKICIAEILSGTCGPFAYVALPTSFAARGLAGEGTATIRFSNQLFGSGSAVVTLTEPKLFLTAPSQLSSGSTSSVYRQFGSALDKSGGATLPTGQEPTISLTYSDPGVLRGWTTVSATGGAQLETVQPGVASVVASAPGYVSSDPLTITVLPVSPDAVGPRIIPSTRSPRVGKNQQICVTAQAQGFSGTIHAKSADEKLLLVSKDSARAGSVETDLSDGTVCLQSLADSGSVAVTLSTTASPDVAPVELTVQLVPSGWAWRATSAWSWAWATNNLTYGLYALDPETRLPFQSASVRPGFSARPGIVLDTPEAGALSANASSGAQEFVAGGPGQAQLSLTQPEGFSKPSARTSLGFRIYPRVVSTTLPSVAGKDVEIVFRVDNDTSKRITLQSDDPTRLLFSTDARTAGTAQVEAGKGTTVFYMQGLTSEGTVNVRLSGEGFREQVLPVLLVPAGVKLAFPNYSSPGNRIDLTTLSTDATFTASLFLDKPNSTTIAAESLMVRPGAGILTASITSSKPEVARVLTESVSFTEGSASSVDVRVRPVAPGETTVAVVPPAAFQTATGQESYRVRVKKAALSSSAVRVGRDLMQEFSASTSGGTSPESLPVTFTSTDPSRLLLASAPGQPCQEKVTVAYTYYTGGARAQACGIAEGTAQVRVSAENFEDSTVEVTIVRPTITLITTSPAMVGRTYALTAKVDSPVRTGASISFSASSSDPALAAIAGTGSIPAGSSIVNLEYTPRKAGQVVFRISGEGFSDQSRLRLAVDLAVPKLELSSLPAEILLARGLIAAVGATFTGPAATRITITSDDPGKLLLTSSPSTPGTASITRDVGPYSSLSFYVIGLAETGTVNLQLTAEGYGVTTTKASFSPAIVQFSQNSRTTSQANPAEITVMARPQAATSSYVNFYSAGRLTIPIQSSNPALGTLKPESITIEAGADHDTSVFTPAAKGVTALTLTPPAGFISTATLSQMVVIVN